MEVCTVEKCGFFGNCVNNSCECFFRFRFEYGFVTTDRKLEARIVMLSFQFMTIPKYLYFSEPFFP